jgi:hypothetical protein
MFICLKQDFRESKSRVWDIFKSGISNSGSMIIYTLDKVTFSKWFTASICCLCCLADPLPRSVGRRRTFPSCRLWLPSEVVVIIPTSILLLQHPFGTAYNLKFCMSYTIILRTIFIRSIFRNFFPYRFSRLLSSFLKINVTRGLQIIIIIIIITTTTTTNCNWVVTRWQYRQNK